MSKRIGQAERKSGGSRVGTFFGGTFFGFLLCLVLIVGTLAFAYFKVSPKWINDKFNANIDLGSEEANNKTLKDFVDGAIGLAENVDTYTLADLKGDFGIDVGDDVYGLDISDLKTVAFKDLGKTIEEKFSNISANELDSINGVDLSGLTDILNKTNRYYYNEGKLYDKYISGNYSEEVTFKYELSQDGTKIITKGQETPIVSNEVKIKLKYLPLTVALEDFVANMGTQITLQELEKDFNVDLPSFFDKIDKSNITINQMEDAIKTLKVADFMEYELDSVTEPGKVIVKDKYGYEVTGVVAAIAQFEINNLEYEVNELTIEDVFDAEDLSSGALALIGTDTKLVDVASVLNERMKTVSVGDLIDNKIVTLDLADTTYYNLNKDRYIAGTNTKLKDIKIDEMTSCLFTLLPLSDTPSI